MMPGDSSGADLRLDDLSAIERVLEQYRLTKDVRLLRLAIRLWDDIEAVQESTASANRSQMH